MTTYEQLHALDRRIEQREAQLKEQMSDTERARIELLIKGLQAARENLLAAL